MQAQEAAARGPRILSYLAAFLIAYGALGVAVQLRVVPLLVSAANAWAGLPSSTQPPVTPAFLAPLSAHFDTLPWLPWAAWLLGAAFLPGAGLRAQSDLPNTPVTRRSISTYSSYVLLLGTAIVGAYMRLSALVPPALGVSQSPYDDEGVYAGASQLFVQGIMPYRDYFFAHPPVAALSYAPAMLYHFNEWGSPTSFMDARYLSVAYSLLTLALLFGIAYRLAGLWGGGIAGLLWALDGRVVEINRKVMLDGPMVLLSCAAILCYLWVRPVLAGSADATRASRRPMLILGIASGLAALSTLTKIAGSACLLAIVVDLFWLHLDNRRVRTSFATLRSALLALVSGVLLAFVVVLGPFLIISPSALLRDIFFFQLLRPGDGVVDIGARIGDITATYANALTPLFAGLGVVALSLRVFLPLREEGGGRLASAAAWRTPVLWTFFSVLLFTYSRSFYSHYYIQMAAPLCLLGAASAIWPVLLRRFFAERVGLWSWVIPAGAALLVAAPFVNLQWTGNTHRVENRIFELVARYMNNAVPPGTAVLTTDEQFNFLAARPPSRSSTGYLVDSYGHLISLGLGLNTRSWDDLANAALHGEHGREPYSVMQRPAAQADLLERVRTSPLIVIHETGRPRFSPATMQQIGALTDIVEQQARYTVYRAK